MNTPYSTYQRRRARFAPLPVVAAIGRRAQMCDPAAIIRTSDRTERVRYRDGDTDDIVETILYMDADSRRWVHEDAAADCLRGATPEATLRNVWSFVKKNVKYRADKPGNERVQSPASLFATGRGDCKSFSIAEAALLRALNIPYKYRFASYKPGGDYTHVYVIARTPRGWVPIDAVHDTALEEVAYVKKTDISPRAAVNGIHADKWSPEPGGTKWNPTPGGTKWIPGPAGEVIVIDTPQPTPQPDMNNWYKIGALAFIIYLLTQQHP